MPSQDEIDRTWGAEMNEQEAKVFEAFNVAVEKRKLGSNPKDAIGSTKVSITKLPMAGVIHGAHGMMDGAEKYGPFNWRENKVIASIYVDAAIRHLANWFEGQEQAKDSEVHHLGHAIACCSILLDAQETGNLIDDRPVFGDPDVVDRLLDRLAEIVKRRTEAKKAKAIAVANDKITEIQKTNKPPGIFSGIAHSVPPIFPNFTGYPNMDTLIQNKMQELAPADSMEGEMLAADIEH